MNTQATNSTAVKAFFVKYKKIIIGAFVLFCVYNFITGFMRGPELPYCSDSNLIDKKIPNMIINKLRQYNSNALHLKITVSDTKETLYDKKAGLRQCTAGVTMRYNGNVHTDDFTYQIAWTNEKEGQYQVKLLED